MEVTVHSGTSRQIFNDEAGRSLLPGIRVAGKTGTLRPDSSEETASWFIGFAPSQKPEIVVSVMLENGAVWRQKAAEVARDLLRVYFHRKGAPKVVDPLAP
jgi:cell division protein FtsI/penicillin-binding protein 2